MENLEQMKYAELQQLAKQFGIKANMKAEKLKIALADYQKKQLASTALGSASCESCGSIDDAVKCDDDLGRCDADMVENVVLLSTQPAVDNSEQAATGTDRDAENSVVLEESATADQSFVCDGAIPEHEPDPEITFHVNDMAAMKRMTYNANEAKSAVDDTTVRPIIEMPTRTGISLSSVKKCKDWSAIHQREFDKMDSLDEFLKKRQNRHRVLKTPIKRAAAFAASLKLPSITTQAEQQRPAAPHQVVFAPSVLSTSKISTNFSAMYNKTPSASTGASSRTPFKVGLSANRSVIAVPSAVKENGSLRTPMDCSSVFNKSLLSTSVMAAKKPVFDLKASLARPITWTPHTGKLKPVSATGHVDVKAVKTKSREERRAEARAIRQDQRQAVLALRRQ